MTVERLTVDQVAGKVAIRLRHLGSGALQSWLRGRARVGCGLAAVVMATLSPVVMAVDASPRRVLMVYSFGRDFMPYAATGISFGANSPVSLPNRWSSVMLRLSRRVSMLRAGTARFWTTCARSMLSIGLI